MRFVHMGAVAKFTKTFENCRLATVFVGMDIHHGIKGDYELEISLV